MTVMSVRMRREPPRFRVVHVRGVELVEPCMVRVTLAGRSWRVSRSTSPRRASGCSCPSPPRRELVMPTWTGNEFLLADGQRPVIRTFTPLLLG